MTHNDSIFSDGNFINHEIKELDKGEQKVHFSNFVHGSGLAKSQPLPLVDS